MRGVTSVFKFIYYDSDGNTQDCHFQNLVKSVNLVVCNINTGVEVKWWEGTIKFTVKSERFQLLKIEQVYNTNTNGDGLIFHIRDIPKAFSTGFKEGKPI